MKLKTTQSMMLAALFAACSVAQAQTPAPAPDYTWSFNVGAVTDYRYRGISQSRFRPALQGGVDFAHKSGFYVGTWLSTIRWLEDIPGGKGPLEWDIYGGYKGSINDSVTYDVGILRYQYPRENFPVSPNTTEVYGALGLGPGTIKYSHSVTNLFGFAGSKGSGYLDMSFTVDLGNGFTLVPHVGYQHVDGPGNSIFSYTDVAVTLNKDFGNGLAASLAAVGTNAQKIAGVPVYISPAGRNLGRNGLVLGVKYSF